MRLINTDLLEIETQSLEDVGQGEIQFYSVEQIDNAPTVLTIPDNPTNGQMLMALFPDIEIITTLVDPLGNEHILICLNHIDIQMSLEWWNSPYKAISGE